MSYWAKNCLCFGLEKNSKIILHIISKKGKVVFFHNVSELLVSERGDNPTKWSNTLKQFVGNLQANYLSVFGHFLCGCHLKR